MGVFAVLANALRYPTQGWLDALLDQGCSLPKGEVKQHFQDYLSQVGQLNLTAWEELYTATWDINPPAAPYIGFQIWGDSYPRGALMTQLRQVMAEKQIDLDGELPDHLIPVLHYLDVEPQPIPELIQVFEKAVRDLRVRLEKKQPDNPYLHIIDAILKVYGSRKYSER
jgi:nitrate reductase delta subunit